jgi:uncharacterized protein with NAD-binding domain and iron-sulfur cluster
VNAGARVVVIGGGVAGLTAAHELQERGYEVVVYERNQILGGKARSFAVPSDDPNEAIRDLPAEHGFRFLPCFYKHLTETLSRIPCPAPGDPDRTVANNLISVDGAAYARHGKPFFHFPTARPDTFGEWVSAITLMLSDPALGVPPNEASFAAFKLVNAMTMCHERREAELDGRTWWDYMRAGDMSPQYRSVIVDGLTQNFVAMDAKNSSTKSVINILARLFNDFLGPGTTIDRLLNGPTSEVWIEHWVNYLRAGRAGQPPVVFHKGQQVQSLVFDEPSSRIAGIRLKPQDSSEGDAGTGRIPAAETTVAGEAGGEPSLEAPAIETEANYFIAAVPIEAMIEILANSAPEIQLHAPSLSNLNSNFLKTNWMSGIMYYLREDVSMDTGHVVYLDSKWALTSISQNQYWTRNVNSYGDSAANGILSVIVSDWYTTSPRIGKTAQQTDDPQELANEALAQVREHLLGRALAKVDWQNMVGFYVDPALEYKQAAIVSEVGAIERLTLGGLMPAREFARRKARLRERTRVVGVESQAARQAASRVGKRKRRGSTPAPEPILEAGMNAIEDPTPDEYIERNLEPLFINTVNSWHLRPNAKTEIGNLFLASDYVKNNTDLATMEGANEAGRRAVNGILEHAQSNAQQCAIYEFDEPPIFAPFRAIDKWMFDLGLPHPGVIDDFIGNIGLADVRRGILWRGAPVFSQLTRTSVYSRLSTLAARVQDKLNRIR